MDGKPNRELTIPLTYQYLDGATAADFVDLPASVIFAEDKRSVRVTLSTVDDDVEDPGEGLKVSFGTLPEGVQVGSWSGPSTILPVIDNDGPPPQTWHVWFGESAYTATKGDTARITLYLDSPWKPERNEALIVPLFTPEHQGGASASDYSGVPESVTFQPGQTQTSFTVQATDDDEESVLVQFRNLFPDGLEVGGRGRAGATTLHIADNDGDIEVTVSFEAANYTAEEGGAVATVRLLLDAAPGRAVTIPLTITGRALRRGTIPAHRRT